MTETVNVTIKAPAIDLELTNILLTPGEKIVHTLDDNILVNAGRENKLIEIESNGTVAVLGSIVGLNNGLGIVYSDAVYARMFSPDECNTKYILPNYDDPDDSSMSFTVVGSLEDGAFAEITQPSLSGSFIFLYSMETHIVTSFSEMVAGSMVESVLPENGMPGTPVIAYSGAECVKIPTGVGDCGYIWSPATSNCELGTEHVVLPIEGRTNTSSYIVQVVGTSSGTNVEVYDAEFESFVPLGTINEKQFLELMDPKTTEALFVKCSHDCVVVQLNKGNVFDDSNTGPFMMPVPSVDRYVHTAVIKSINKITKRNYANIVTNTSNLNDMYISLCNQSVETLCTTWKSVPGLPGYRYCSFKIETSEPILISDSSENGRFAVWVYGHVSSKSGYGYLAIDWNANGKLNLTQGPCLVGSHMNKRDYHNPCGKS